MFPVTNWTSIERARTTAARSHALGDIASRYRTPLLAIARKRGLCAEEAEDAVQELFEKLVARDAVRGFDRGRGRLRNLLCVALDRVIAHRLEREHARKRGGGAVTTRFDDTAVATEPAFAELFDRHWRAAMLERAFARLAAEPRSGPFAVVQAYFRGDDPPSLATLAVQFSTTVPALKSLLHRARARFRAIVTEEVAATLGSLSDLDDELRTLVL